MKSSPFLTSCLTSLSILLGYTKGQVPEKWHANRIPTWNISDTTSAASANAWESPAKLLAVLWKFLPAEVHVFPGENYYYWRLQWPAASPEGAAQEIRGNLRLARGARELGFLNMGYAWDTPTGASSKYQALSATEGIEVTCLSRFLVKVAFQGKIVTFHLAEISQTPPEWLKNHAELTFVQRTQDESGATFLLCHHKSANRFLWFLDEEAPNGEPLVKSVDVALHRGQWSGFLYAPYLGHLWLWAVNGEQLRKNGPYDGPFDQLSDNYAEETHFQQWLELSYPSLNGEIDAFGYYLKQSGPLKPGTGKRIALKLYGIYDNHNEIESRWQESHHSDLIGKFFRWLNEN